jgi:hypothetical protein
MATENSSSNDKTQAKRATTEAKKSAAASAKASKRAAAKTVAAEKKQARSVTEAAVDLPVGAVLSVSDRLTDLVEPWTSRGSAEKQLKSYRTRVRKTVKRTERRGATARRKATTEARKHQRSVNSSLQRNRSEVEQRVRRAIDEQTSRAQGLVEQVTDQLSALR